MKTIQLLLMASSLVLGTAPLTAQEPVEPEPVLEISLRQDVELVGAAVLVRDLAKVESADAELRTRVEELQVAPRPAEGFARTFRRTDLERRLIEAGLPRDAFTLTGAEAAIGRPKTTLISAERLLQVADGIATAWIAREPDSDIEYEPLGRVPATAVPPGRTGVQLRGSVLPNRAGLHGGSRLTVDLEVVIDGEVWRKLPIHYRLRRFAMILAPARGARAGERMADLELVERRVEVHGNEPSGGYAAQQDLLGMVARVDLRPGRPVRRADLAEPALVQRNDPVRLVARRGTIRVAVKAIALEAGAAGAHIRVQNLATGRAVQAIVQGPGLVVVPGDVTQNPESRR